MPDESHTTAALGERRDRAAETPARSESGAAQHLYRANGLSLRSEMELPALHPGSGPPDVVVRYGTIPSSLEGASLLGPRFQRSPDEYLLEMEGVARYWVRKGEEVVVEPHPEATAAEVRVFMLSSVMGVLAHQHGLLPIHASAVRTDGGCVLFAGDSSVGKSTLAAAFHRRGYGLVADDICAVTLDAGGEPRVHPGYRHLKLWEDSIAHVGEDMERGPRIRRDVDKYSVVPPGPAADEPLPIERIFVFGTEDADREELVPLRGRSKMATLVRETYRFRLMGGVRRRRHLELCQAVARTTPIVLVRRPRDLGRLDLLVDLLEEAVRSGGPA